MESKVAILEREIKNRMEKSAKEETSMQLLNEDEFYLAAGLCVGFLEYLYKRNLVKTNTMKTPIATGMYGCKTQNSFKRKFINNIRKVIMYIYPNNPIGPLMVAVMDYGGDEDGEVTIEHQDLFLSGTILSHQFFKIISASEAGAKGGAARTNAKIAASRANGAKGGRPPKAIGTIPEGLNLSERDRRIVDMRKEGKPLQEIAEEVGLSKQRVSQIIKQIKN